jgi:hypothetical protein
MDGISEIQLKIERMSEHELSDVQWQYCKESIDAGFYPGKRESEHFRMLEMLTAEITIRMAAE